MAARAPGRPRPAARRRRRPAARSRSAPPAAPGHGSRTATSTRATPAAIRASVHGPVRPECTQGSRVTTAVAPRARSPAAASATISACGPPARSWKPSPTVAPPASSSTQPTTGLGSAEPAPRSASSTARPAPRARRRSGPSVCRPSVRARPIGGPRSKSDSMAACDLGAILDLGTVRAQHGLAERGAWAPPVPELGAATHTMTAATERPQTRPARPPHGVQGSAQPRAACADPSNPCGRSMRTALAR